MGNSSSKQYQARREAILRERASRASMNYANQQNYNGNAMPIASQYGETVTYGNNFVAPIEGRLVSASDIGYGKLREPAFENVGNAFQIGWRNPGLGDYNYQNDVRRDSRLLKPEPVVIEKTVRTRVTEIPGTIQPIYADKINTPISILNSSNRSDGSPAAMPANYVQLIPNENNTMTSQIRY